MDFVPSTYYLPLFAGIGLFFMGAVLAATALDGPFSRGREIKAYVSASFLALAGISLLLLAWNTDSGQSEARQQELSEKYGASMYAGEFRLLSYPSTEPKVDFKVYGTGEATLRTEDGYSKEDVTLIWEGGKMTLASPDESGELQPLRLRN